MTDTTSTYALLYNKIPAEKDYNPGDVISAEELGCRYASLWVAETSSIAYDDSVTVSGDWEICGHLSQTASAVCLYVKVL
ncbi:hypothetical protein D1298_14420 [Salmonella enterica]|nr:hypothetical protein [Salmonella enterica]EGL2187055.1 hypothetical protein [Salmonella enterica subsp. enterica serovar Agbeni]HCM2251514.1 hypothetical protein [Salmonella enterica subsp. enterica serovar Agbeni]